MANGSTKSCLKLHLLRGFIRKRIFVVYIEKNGGNLDPYF